jgi:hypothetical protein
MIRSGFLFLVFFVLILKPSAEVIGQVDEDKVADQEAAAEKKGETKKDTESASEPEPVVTVSQPKAPRNPKEVRLHLVDGSVITGELTVSHVTVETEFGELRIPVEKLMGFKPGLDSNPELTKRIETLVEQLGGNDYKARESAHRELASMGVKLQNEIDRFSDGGNAERKKHLAEIRTEIEQLSEQADDFDEETADPWIRGDAVHTPDFTIVGSIKEKSFAVNSRYGVLNVDLSEISFVDREGGNAGESNVRIVVSGNDFIQANPKSTGIKVTKGDTIKISADGQITLTPWGNNYIATPDGNSQSGKFRNTIDNGALTAQIGSSEFIMVGSKKSFVAKESGLLKLGTAMMDNYTNGYNYPGEFKVKVKVIAGE